ncbi:sodium/potassium-transporting ATPase subunit beta-like [Argonauta hians]
MASRTSSDVDTVTTVPSRTTFQDRSDSLTNFVYNPRDGTFFYKSPKRWIKLICFYFIFYTILLLFTAGLLAAVYNILDWNYPRMRGPDSIFRGNPGLSFRPNPDYDSTLIRYVKGDGPTTRKYIDHIESFIRFYENKNQIGENFAVCEAIVRRERREKVCRFDIKTLGGSCVKQQNYGYDDGMPCVLLKLNKIFDWEPVPYNKSEVPEEIKDSYKEYAIKVTCKGELPADQENLGSIAYYPDEGFHFKYFPYLNQQGYRSPLVFVQFEQPKTGILMMIECKAWAKNILHNRLQKIGTVHFELLVD